MLHDVRNRQRQAGMTAIGWVIVLAVIGIFVLAVLRIGPVYFEYYKISSVMSGLEGEFSGGESAKNEIVSYLSKRFDVEAINVIGPTDVEIKRKDEMWEVRAAYDHRAPFIGNLDFIATFDKAVEVPR